LPIKLGYRLIPSLETLLFSGDSTHILPTQYGQVPRGKIPCNKTDLVRGFDSLLHFLGHPRADAECGPCLNKTLKRIVIEEDANLWSCSYK